MFLPSISLAEKKIEERENEFLFGAFDTKDVFVGVQITHDFVVQF